MSIKQNIKRRMLMVLALAMMVAVLVAGTAHAQSQPPTSLTTTPSADSGVVGEPVTFTSTVTNDTPYDIGPVQIYDGVGGGWMVSASSSQGQCTLQNSGGLYPQSLKCDLGILPPGATAYIDVVAVPVQPGSLSNQATDVTPYSSEIVAKPAPDGTTSRNVANVTIPVYSS